MANSPYGHAPRGQYREETTNVGSFPPNAFGLYNMHGNVWEWCQDIWHNNYNEATNDRSAWETEGNINIRVFRGGCWNDNSGIWRSARRNYTNTNDRNNYRDFRIISSCPVVSAYLYVAQSVHPWPNPCVLLFSPC